MSFPYPGLVPGTVVAVVVDQPEIVVAGDTWVVAVARQVAAVPSCLDHPGHIATRLLISEYQDPPLKSVDRTQAREYYR